MQTLHDLLRESANDKPGTAGASAQPVDLRRRYSKIGISAVAAAAEFTERREVDPTTLNTAPDRSSARGLSDRRPLGPAGVALTGLCNCTAIIDNPYPGSRGGVARTPQGYVRCCQCMSLARHLA